MPPRSRRFAPCRLPGCARAHPGSLQGAKRLLRGGIQPLRRRAIQLHWRNSSAPRFTKHRACLHGAVSPTQSRIRDSSAALPDHGQPKHHRGHATPRRLGSASSPETESDLRLHPTARRCDGAARPQAGRSSGHRCGLPHPPSTTLKVACTSSVHPGCIKVPSRLLLQH